MNFIYIVYRFLFFIRHVVEKEDSNEYERIIKLENVKIKRSIGRWILLLFKLKQNVEEARRDYILVLGFLLICESRYHGEITRPSVGEKTHCVCQDFAKLCCQRRVTIAGDLWRNLKFSEKYLA